MLTVVFYFIEYEDGPCWFDSNLDMIQTISVYFEIFLVLDLEHKKRLNLNFTFDPFVLKQPVVIWCRYIHTV